MSMALPGVDGTLTRIESQLLLKQSPTYTAYYNGKMSYTLHGKSWDEYVAQEFPGLKDQYTSENIFKTVIDMYAENLVPQPKELRGVANILVPLLMRGECPVVVTADNVPHFPEHFEMMSDGTFTVAAIFTRSLKTEKDYVTFVRSDGVARLFSKPIPEDFGPANREGYSFEEETIGNTLFRFALDDKGFGAQLSALQDRVNHSIIDTTIVAEMYARPFWYLMKVEMPPKNPFMPNAETPSAMTEQKKNTGGATGRIFTTSSEGPFGQLDPPTIGDMIAYHDSIIDKVPLTTGVPAHALKPGEGVPPTGVALKVLSKRFNNKVARIRDNMEDTLRELAELLGVEKTKEVAAEKLKDDQGNLLPDDQQPKPTYEYEFWNTDDDLLQDALDDHGIKLSQIGYPLEYIASVVTPGVDLTDYQEEGGLDATGFTPALPGQPKATPDQVAAYAQDPGQRAVR